MRRFFDTSDEIALTIIRITTGGVILPHGLQKLFGRFGGHGPAATAASFQEWFGLPYWITALVIAAESVGAVCLIAGFASRLTAASIGVVMVGAIVLVTGRWGFFMNWYSQPRGEGFELHLLVLGMVLAIVLRGGGRWSIDRWLTQRMARDQSEGLLDNRSVSSSARSAFGDRHKGTYASPHLGQTLDASSTPPR